VVLIGLLWDEANEDHIAAHQVSRQEVVEVVFGAGAVFAVDDSHRRGRLLVFGLTAAGRALLVVLDEPTTTGTAYVVTARPMTTVERRDYEEETKP
jgi:uncharacterized DUF497 family protein